MLSVELYNCVKKADEIASRKNAEDEAQEQEIREKQFIDKYNQLLNQIDIIYEMNKIFPIKIREREFTSIKSGYEKGKDVFKTAKLPRKSKAPDTIQTALDVALKQKKNWINLYKKQDEIQELQNMLQLIETAYKGKPSAKDLYSSISKISKVDVIDRATIVSTGNAILQTREIISNMDIDDEIIDFLKKVSAGKAKLDDLNDRVMKWLKANNLLSKISISIQ